LILALFERPDGVGAEPGNRVVYDLERDKAHFGAVAVAGPAVVWELGEYAADGAALAAAVTLDPGTDWMMRCDRIDFPPGGVAYRHTHPGPGIRRLLHGSIRIEAEGEAHEYGAGEAWFEAGPAPVYAAASETEPSAFVRVMLLEREWEGRRTIRYVDPADEEKPKLQRPTIFFDRPLAL
jgi:quercetin dioxygenase-like cupin family protein